MDAVEDIKQRLNIEDVISEYVALKRSGRNFRGLSPFTNEKTPSFMVSPEKQIWHDFSSGRGGNMFSFIMEVEGLDFKGALELLARKAGLDLANYQRAGSNHQLKERLYGLLEKAAKFYQAQLSQHQSTLAYLLKNRRFEKATILTFRLGYAPNTGDALMKYLLKQGFTAAEIKQAGLSTQRYKGPSDMFKARLMIPLMDSIGRVVGFTARQLDDDPDAPKYINTPQTLLYDKGRQVYGLNLAKDSIRKSGYGVLVEGNLDVIASHQAGVKQVVATAGTALTEYHLKTVQRYAPEVRLAFDQDSAGLKAAERAIPLASKLDVNLSIITVPSGKDPDELIRSDPKSWQAVIAKPEYAIDWLIEHHAGLNDIKSGKGKKQFSDEILKVVKLLKDPVEQDHYLQILAVKTEVSYEALKAKLSTTKTDGQSRLRQSKSDLVAPDKDQLELRKTTDHLLSIILFRPDYETYLRDLSADMLAGEEAGKLFSQWLSSKTDSAKAAVLHSSSDYAKILSLLYETLYQSVNDAELGFEAARLRSRLIEQHVKQRKQQLTSEMPNANDKQMAGLLDEAKQLDLLLKTALNGGKRNYGR